MSLKKIEQIKQERGFRIWDLLVYGVIIAIIVVVFITVYSTRDSSSLSGIRVTVQGNEVFKYNFKNKEIDLIDENTVTVLTEDNTVIEVKVECDGGYNVFQVYKDGSVKMKEADCSKYHPDCVYMAAVTNNSGFIYCMPHGLRIEPYKYVPGSEIIM